MYVGIPLKNAWISLLIHTGNIFLQMHNYLRVEVEALPCRPSVDSDGVRKMLIFVAVLLKGHGLPDAIHGSEVFLLASVRSTSFVVVDNAQIDEKTIYKLRTHIHTLLITNFI